MNICSKEAITMIEDEYGFLYPKINEKRCIGCGLCQKVCAYKDKLVGNKAISAYAAVSKVSDLMISASGGIFTAFAVKILKDGGSVYGAACLLIDDKIQVQHIRIDSIKDLPKLAGSKYVQSSLGTIFKSVKIELDSGKNILFSGMPCQCEALKKYLDKKYDNLLLMDLICHGIPNTKMLNDYVRTLCLNRKIVDIQFRSKIKGWGNFVSAITFEDKSIVYEDSLQSSYYYMFLKSYLYRDSCYHCKYAKAYRIGDITIGDFWGIEKEHPEIFSNNKIDLKKGISCLIINNKHGKMFLENNMDSMFLLESSFEKIARHNEQLNQPSILPKGRKKILRRYKERGYSEIERYFKIIYKREKTVNKIKKILKQIEQSVLNVAWEK